MLALRRGRHRPGALPAGLAAGRPRPRRRRTATVRLIGRADAEQVGAAAGTDSVDAVFQAIGKIVGEGSELLDFTIDSHYTAGIP